MDNVDRFLAELADSRLREQTAACAGFTMPANLELPPDLELALGYRWNTVTRARRFFLHQTGSSMP